jgi:signal transduction histidine kinase
MTHTDPNVPHEDEVSQIAHDLKTPLTVIRGVSEILLDNPDLPDGERSHLLGAVLEESERLHQNIERWLTTLNAGPPALPVMRSCSLCTPRRSLTL